MSERVAETVATETQHLDPETRRQVDTQLQAAGIGRMGFKAATARVRKFAYQADRQGYLQRGRTERKHRRVGLRPAPDTMAVLTGYLPVEQGIACYAALRQHADTAVATGDGRTRDQIMADTLVERLTGQATAADMNVELQIMMPLEALIDPHSNKPATIPGYGPLPHDMARNILITSQDANTGAASSPHPQARRSPGRLWPVTPPAATSTAGSANSSGSATKAAATPTVTHPSATSTTSPGTAMEDPPP